MKIPKPTLLKTWNLLKRLSASAYKELRYVPPGVPASPRKTFSSVRAEKKVFRNGTNGIAMIFLICVGVGVMVL